MERVPWYLILLFKLERFKSFVIFIEHHVVSHHNYQHIFVNGTHIRSTYPQVSNQSTFVMEIDNNHTNIQSQDNILRKSTMTTLAWPGIEPGTSEMAALLKLLCKSLDYERQRSQVALTA